MGRVPGPQPPFLGETRQCSKEIMASWGLCPALAGSLGAGKLLQGPPSAESSMAPRCPWATSTILVPIGAAETQCDVSCSRPASPLLGTPACRPRRPDGHSLPSPPSAHPGCLLAVTPVSVLCCAATSRSPPDNTPPQQAGPGPGLSCPASCCLRCNHGPHQTELPEAKGLACPQFPAWASSAGA